MSQASTTADSGLGVTNQLASLVPAFDPSVDDIIIYQQKVELVAAAWPKQRLTELVTRLILGCKGSAFQKLQLHQAELLSGEMKAVHKLVELLGGHWGKIPLQTQYQDAERALFETHQHQDESNDSYIARADILWSRLLSRKMDISELQAYILLRGSLLATEEKKRVILESEKDGKLTVEKVTDAIRTLGAVFFQEMTGQKKATRTKVYDQANLTMDATVDDPQESESALNATEDTLDDFIEEMVHEGDTDALLIADYEQAMAETLQEDAELATAYSAYQQARHRLTERYKNRGFWPTRPFAGNAPKGKGYGGFKASGKGKSFNQPRRNRSLQERIMNSSCRLCGQKGHWKAECPMKPSGSQASTSNSAAPTTTVITEEIDPLPLEFRQLPMSSEIMPLEVVPVPQHSFFECFVSILEQPTRQFMYRGRILGKSRHVHEPMETPKMSARERLRKRLMIGEPMIASRDVMKSDRSSSVSFVQTPSQFSTGPKKEVSMPHNHVPCETALFATHSTFGVLDLGASKTVIGADNVRELIEGLDPIIQKGLSRCQCDVTFRFGNQGTLTSTMALVVPIGKLQLKIAVVPGKTPFLISNTLMRTLAAQIDCEHRKFSSAKLDQPIAMHLTSRGLFLVDLNEIALSARRHALHSSDLAKPVTETFLSDTAHQKSDVSTSAGVAARIAEFENRIQQKQVKEPGIQTNKENSSCFSKASEPAESQIMKVMANVDHQTSGPASAQDSTLAGTSILPKSTDHVAEPALEGLATECSLPSGGPEPPDHDGPRERGDHLREQIQRHDTQPSLARPGMVPVHAEPIREQHQDSSSPCHQVHQAHDRAPRAVTDASPEDTKPGDPSRGVEHCLQSQGEATGQGQRGRISPRSPCQSEHAQLFVRPNGRGRRSLGLEFRDVCIGDHDAESLASRSRLPRHERSNAVHGECSPASDPAHRAEHQHGRASDQPRGRSVETAARNNDDSVFTAMHRDATHVQKLVRQFSKELNQKSQEVKPLGKPFCLAEVFCSERSPLTHQVQQLQEGAFRFGYDQGDLATPTGRAKLFTMMIQHRPKHVWMSPDCGPWSSWAQLNASRSPEALEAYQQRRHELLYQIALCIVLFRYQYQQGLHFHLEQPIRSMMLYSPWLIEIRHYTRLCQFDMCKVGDLKCPQTGMYMRKSMGVITTNPALYRFLHGKVCNREHEHQAIEGSIPGPHGMMYRTEFTAVYPRKFARAVAQVLGKGTNMWPFMWQPGMIARVRSQDPCHVDAKTAQAYVSERSRAIQKPSTHKDRFPKSEITIPIADDHPTKKRRVTGKHQSESS